MDAKDLIKKAEDRADEPPPILGTWRRLYSVVIANTLLVYLLLFLFSFFAAR